MKINYDQDVDILRILLTDAAIEESDEVETGVIFDYDNQGNVVGIEILDASKRNTQARQLEYSISSVQANFIWRMAIAFYGQRKSKNFRPKGRGMENVLLANPWFPLQAYIFRPKGRGITPKLLLNDDHVFIVINQRTEK